jgi:fibronectin-binding autotransporter adhesin
MTMSTRTALHRRFRAIEHWRATPPPRGNARAMNVAAGLLALILASHDASAATCTATSGTGSWIVPTTWTGCAGGVPGAADTARINGGSTITIPSGESVTVAAIDFGPTGLGTLNVDGTLSVGDVTHGFATINGPGAITVTGTYNWSGNGALAGVLQGGIAPPLTFAPGSVWNLTGNSMPLRRRAVVQQGVANFSAGNLDCSDTVSWQIASSATLAISHEGRIGNQAVGCQIRNNGTIRKTGAGTTFRINDSRIRLDNHGLIEVLSGTFSFEGSGGPTNHSGTFRTSAGATLVAPTTTANFDAGTRFEGGGSVTFTGGGGPRTFNTSVDFEGPVILAGSGGTSDLVVAAGVSLGFLAGLDWQQGRLAGPGTYRVPSARTLTLSGTQQKVLFSGAQLILEGSTVWQGGNLVLSAPPTLPLTRLFIAQGADFQVQFRPATIDFGNGDPLFENAGTFTATANAAAGPLTFTSGTGDSLINRGTTRLAGAVTVQRRWRQTGGVFELQDAQLTVPGTPLRPLTLDGGRLTGTGRITGDVLNTAAVLAPGSSSAPGSLEIAGRYTEAAGARLAFRVGGVATGEYDELLLSGPFGTAAIAGTLAVQRLGGYQFAPNDSVPILIANARTGAFSAVELDPGFAPPPLVQQLAGGVVLGLTTGLFRDGFEVP